MDVTPCHIISECLFFLSYKFMTMRSRVGHSKSSTVFPVREMDTGKGTGNTVMEKGKLEKNAVVWLIISHGCVQMLGN